MNLGDYAKGEAELELLLQHNPDEAGPNNDLGYLYAEQGKNLEKAESMIRKALQEEPGQLRLSRQPGLGPVQAGQAQGGARALKKAAERMKPDRTGRTRRRRHDPRAPGRRLLPAPGARQGRGLLASRPRKAAEEAVPPDKRLAEIRKKLES